MIAEIDDISTMLDEDRRTSDPNRGVICSRACPVRQRRRFRSDLAIATDLDRRLRGLGYDRASDARRCEMTFVPRLDSFQERRLTTR